MGKLEFLIIHCSATPAGRIVTAKDIREWHLYGRGWSQVGYSDLIHPEGQVENLVEYNEDGWISAGEITNGALDYNGIARHVCITGGQDEDGNDYSRQSNFEQVLTPEQYTALWEYVTDFLFHHRKAQIMGHYMANSHKECPGFDVQRFLRSIEVAEENIYQL